MLWFDRSAGFRDKGMGCFAGVLGLCRIMQVMTTRIFPGGAQVGGGLSDSGPVDPVESVLAVADPGRIGGLESGGGGGPHLKIKAAPPRRIFRLIIIPGSAARTLFGCRTVAGACLERVTGGGFWRRCCQGVGRSMSRLRSMCRTAFLYSGRRASDALIMGVFWAVRRVSSLTKWESGLGDGQAVLESGLGDGLTDGQSLGLSLCCFGCYTGK